MRAHYANDLFAQAGRRNITRLIRTAPEHYANRLWSIPVMSPVIEAPFARELALSVMCGRESECYVELTTSR